ncbi:DUF357 domain-containing protein [[Eubacterium] cellulosolvens]
MREDAQERAERYISSMDAALQTLKGFKCPPIEITGTQISKVLESAERYLTDAKFYLKVGKHVTALASVSYSEGLLDSLHFLDLIPEPWRREDATFEA